MDPHHVGRAAAMVAIAAAACVAPESPSVTAQHLSLLETDGSNAAVPAKTLPSRGPVTAVRASCPRDLFERYRALFFVADRGPERALFRSLPDDDAEPVALTAVDPSAVLARTIDGIVVAEPTAIRVVRWTGAVITLRDWTTARRPRAIATDDHDAIIAYDDRIEAVTPDGAESLVALDATGVRSIAVDAEHVYWISGGESGQGALFRRARGGGPVVRLEPVLRGLRTILQSGPNLYVATSPDSPEQRARGEIWLVAKDQHEKPVRLAVTADAVTMSLSQSHLYFAEPSRGAIKRVGKDGTAPSVSLVATFEPGWAAAITLGSDEVYWSLGCGSASDGIRRLPKDEIGPNGCGSKPRVVADDDVVTAIATHGTWIHYATAPTNSAPAKLRRVWRNGGPVTTLRAAPEPITELVAGDDGIAWLEGDALKVLPRLATTPVEVARGVVSNLTVSADALYFVDRSDTLQRVSRADLSITALGSVGAARHIRADDEDVYVASLIDRTFSVVRARGAAARLSVASTTVPAGTTVSDFALGASSLHATLAGPNGGARLRIGKDGSALETFSLSASSTRGIAVLSNDTVIVGSKTGPHSLVRHDARSGERAMVADGAALAFASDGRCSIYAVPTEAGGASLRKLSSYALGIRDDDEEFVWEADLHPVNDPDATGIGAVRGKTKIRVRGDALTVTTHATGLAPSISHPHHIHRASDCASPRDDNNGDGFLDIVEGLRVHKGVIVPLDQDLLTLGMGKGFPVAAADGTLDYTTTTSLSSLEDLRNEDLAPETRAVVLHGVAKSFPFPPTVAGIEGVAPHRNIPLACGELRRLEPP